jgi:hypothetical protein
MRFINSLIINIYIASFQAYKRRGYKIYLCCSKSRVRHVCSAVSYRTRFRNRRHFYSYDEVIRGSHTRRSYDVMVACCASVNWLRSVFQCLLVLRIGPVT